MLLPLVRPPRIQADEAKQAKTMTNSTPRTCLSCNTSVAEHDVPIPRGTDQQETTTKTSTASPCSSANLSCCCLHLLHTLRLAGVVHASRADVVVRVVHAPPLLLPVVGRPAACGGL